MIHDIFLYLVAFANLVSMIHLGMYVVGANTYDIKQFVSKKQRDTKNSRRKRELKQPLITVVVPAYNEEVGIIRTLDSIRKSTYTNYEVIVVDDGSKDRTSEVVQQYLDRLPKHDITTYMAREARTGRLVRHLIKRDIRNPRIELVTQENRGKGAALNNAINNYARGQFVMCLDADSLIREDALANTVEHFRDPSVLGVAANVRVMGNNGWLSLLQRFEHMIGYRSKKFYSMTSTEFVIGGVASTYRRTTLRKVGGYDTDTMTEDIGLSLKVLAQQGNSKKRILYAADVVAMTGGVLTYKQLIRQRYRWKMGMLQNLYKYRSMMMRTDRSKYSLGITLYRLPMSILSELLLILSPFMIGYIIYISVSYHTFGVVLGAYLTITMYVLWNVWPDEYLTLRQKIKMSVFSLYMYGIFYAMDLVQLIAVIKCIANYKTIIRGNQGHGNWTPPTRAAQPLAAI